MDFEYEINKWWFSNGDKLIEYADAIVFLLFLIAVLYIFIFSLASLKKTRNKYPPARKKHPLCRSISCLPGRCSHY